MQGLPLQAFMQGLQPAQVVFAGNPLGMMAPQYPAIAPMLQQAPPPAQFPAPADQPWFQALVSAVSKAVMKDIEKLNAPPAAAPADLSPENEKILIDALKKGKEDKLPMDRIFQDLCKVRTRVVCFQYTQFDVAANDHACNFRSMVTRRTVSAIPRPDARCESSADSSLA